MEPDLFELVDWAKQAGDIARSAFSAEHTIGFKSDTDVVTEVDFACEKLLKDHILGKFPDHTIHAEESGSTVGNSDHSWYIDPLDGTINYSHRLPIYAISIAYQLKGELELAVVYDPSRDECFSAQKGKGAWLNGASIHVSNAAELQKSLLVTGFPYTNPEKYACNLRIFGNLTSTTQGVRRLGSAALDICWVSCGRMDGYWEQEIHAWDIAAGILIAEEAGGTVTDIEGGRDFLNPPYSLVAAAPGIHGQLLKEIQKEILSN